jgi:hypothetical protein
LTTPVNVMVRSLDLGSWHLKLILLLSMPNLVT